MVTNSVIKSPNSFVEFSRKDIEQAIFSRFAQQVNLFPNHIAVRTTADQITYKELDSFSNRVAHALIAKCGTHQEPIALLFEPTVQMVAAILGVLKAGKFFLPLDPTSPVTHNRAILERSGASHVLTDTKNLAIAQNLASPAALVVNVDKLDSQLSSSTVGELATADTPAYVLYTSGSTGQPKGVLHNHRNVLHAIRQHTNSLRISSEDRISLVASYGRIAGMTSIWRALLNGATLCMFNLRSEGWEELVHWLSAEGITIYQSVPTLYRHWAKRLTDTAQFPKLRLIHLGGEPVITQDVMLFKKHFSDDCTLLHNLGSTEVSTYRQNFISKDTPLIEAVVPVGYPVEDKDVSLIDEMGHEVGFNEVGEIVVKSRYLAVEYWQEPKLTSEAFVPVPNGNGERVFRTGDLGRMRSDGCLEHMGRKDRQVKIRGIRIEPAEIEAVLGQDPAVQQAVVVAGKDVDGYNQLIGYVIPSPGTRPSSTTLRNSLRQRLPEYMIPAAFVMLDRFPLTPSGKVDQLALPAPSLHVRQSDMPFVAPSSTIEKTITQIWEEVLSVPGIGLQDRFLDLGGNSLRAMQVASRLQNALNRVLPLQSLFTFETIAEQAAAVEKYLEVPSFDNAESQFLAEIEAMGDDEAERLLAMLDEKGEGKERKISQWQMEGVSKAYLDVRSAIPGTSLEVDVMLKIIRQWCPNPRTALDLGCGDGFLGRTLHEHFPDCHVYFVDFSEPMLDAVREKQGATNRATIIKADFTNPEWTAQLGDHSSFDLVVSGLSIHHQTDPRKKQLYHEIYDLITSGGIFLNLEQVASATASVADIYHEFFIDHLHDFYRRIDPGKPREEVAEGFYSSPARKENILAPVDTQCAWLRQIGFQDVDCFFKVLEQALFGGRK
ncbi:amino acid adenylation domain-containing protein [Allocoleopsis sp.]|uniref:amino acid adenylation domain-containing protein n=1 Tax=Allocoleopsis sp. TaxID=3088169 RepID=UPI002FD3112F